MAIKPLRKRYFLHLKGPTNIAAIMGDLNALEPNISQVITNSILLDNSMGKIICLFFAQHLDDTYTTLNELIVSANFFGFENKRAVLDALLRRNNLRTNEEIDNFSKNIRQIGATRNAFAHGTVKFQSSEPYLEYFKGEIKRQPLTHEYWQSLDEKYESVFSFLESVQADILAATSAFSSAAIKED